MNGGAVDGGYKSSEQSIVQVRAVVMRYDDSSRRWIHTGSVESMSRVDIYHHLVNNSFRVVGRSLEDREVTINAVISRNLKYNKATPSFHQWRDSKAIHGLNFASEDDADAFANALFSAMELLNTLRDHQQQQQQQQIVSNPQPTKKSTAASTGNTSSERYDTRQYDVTSMLYGGGDDATSRQYDIASRQHDTTSRQYGSTEKDSIATARQYDPVSPSKALSPAADTSTSVMLRVTGGNSSAAAPPPAPPLPPAAPGPHGIPIAHTLNAPPAPPPPPPPAPGPFPSSMEPVEEVESSSNLATALKGVKLRKTAEVVTDEETQARTNRPPTVAPSAKSKNPPSGKSTLGSSTGRAASAAPPATPSKNNVMSEMARKLKERKEKVEGGGGGGGEGETYNVDTYRANQHQYLNISESRVATSDDHNAAEMSLRHAGSTEAFASGRQPSEDSRTTTAAYNKPVSRPTVSATTHLSGRSGPPSVSPLREELVVLREEILSQIREELEIAKRDIINAIRAEAWSQTHDPR